MWFQHRDSETRRIQLWYCHYNFASTQIGQDALSLLGQLLTPHLMWSGVKTNSLASQLTGQVRLQEPYLWPVIAFMTLLYFDKLAFEGQMAIVAACIVQSHPWTVQAWHSHLSTLLLHFSTCHAWLCCRFAQHKLQHSATGGVAELHLQLLSKVAMQHCSSGVHVQVALLGKASYTAVFMLRV